MANRRRDSSPRLGGTSQPGPGHARQDIELAGDHKGGRRRQLKSTLICFMELLFAAHVASENEGGY